MPFDWDDLDVTVNPALVRAGDYNSNPYNVSTNAYGLGSGGHIVNFPLALGDLAIFGNVLPDFADLVSGYADAADASATAAAASAATLTATSTTSLALQDGEKTVTTQSGKVFLAGDTVRLTSDANPDTHWMDILVTSYSTTTLIGDVQAFAGSGSRADWTIRLTGHTGRAAGFAFVWSTNTDNSDPTTGKIKIDNATIGSATALYISETSRDGSAMSSVLALWGGSTSTIKGRLIIAEPSTPANVISLDITSTRTDNGTWDTFAVASGAGTIPADGAIVHVWFTPKGDKGDTGTTGDTGATGSTGAAGTNGTDGGLEFQLNTATSGDPGSGKFLFNNATFASATAWHISETDNNSLGVATLLAALDGGAGTNKILVYALKQGGSAFYSFWVTAALTDAGAYNTFPITPITSAGSPSNNDEFHFIMVPLEKGDTGSTGSTGATGPLASLSWTFDGASQTDSDPGSGKLRFNHATYSSVTSLFFDNNEAGGASVTAWLDALDDSTNTAHRGFITIVEKDDATHFAVYYVSGSVTDGTGYRKVAVTYVIHNGALTDTGTVGVSFSPTGNKGADGAGSGDVVGPASATDNALALYDTTTGKLLKNSTVEQTSGVLAPVTTDTVALGSTSKMWSDLFLASGATINADNGNAVITHSAGIWTVSTGDLRVTTAGTNAASVVTVGGTQTLTNKTLTSPAITTPTGIVKGDISLGNVDNTSDANKPVSTAAQTLFDLKRIVRVRAATTGNVTISTALNNGDSLDGLTLATGELVAVVAQTSPAENGIFVVGASPARHTDLDAFADYPGLLVTVQEGTANADTVWLCTANAGGTIDSTALTFVQQGGPSGAGGRAVLAGANAGAIQTTLSLVPGTNVQAYAGATITLGGSLTVTGSFTTAFAVTANTSVTLPTSGTLATLGGAETFNGNKVFSGTVQLPATVSYTSNGSIVKSGNHALTLTTTGTTNVTYPTTGTLAVTADFIGKQAIPVPATAMIAATTNGAASGTVETTTNDVMLGTYDFDASTAESVQFSIAMPEQWDEGTVTFKVYWSHAATTTNFGVAWDLAGVAFGNDDAQDTAFGTAVVVTDTGGTTDDLYITSESSAVTIAGTPGAGDLVFFRLRRAPANGSDTMAIDARVQAVTVYITTNAGHD